jgi:hypothetical protein
LRKPVLAVLVALVALVGAYAPVAAAQSSTAKVVIIVGATHAVTPTYRQYADELYLEAIKHTPNVVRVYSPNATWKNVKAATKGANVVIYLGHGNGWPSPYGTSPNGYVTKDGFGLNKAEGQGDYNNVYYGEPWLRGDYDEGLALAPNAIVFLHHLCYASGNSEPGHAQPTLSVARQRVDNYGAGFLAAGASAVVADGHSHDGYYLRALFTQPESLLDMWRGAPNYHGHEIAFTPTRSVGAGYMDPNTAGANPSGYYRSIVGNVNVMTHTVIGIKLPPGVRGTPGVTVVPTHVSVLGDTSVSRSSGTRTTTSRGAVTPRLTVTR